MLVTSSRIASVYCSASSLGVASSAASVSVDRFVLTWVRTAFSLSAKQRFIARIKPGNAGSTISARRWNTDSSTLCGSPGAAIFCVVSLATRVVLAVRKRAKISSTRLVVAGDVWSGDTDCGSSSGDEPWIRSNTGCSGASSSGATWLARGVSFWRRRSDRFTTSASCTTSAVSDTSVVPAISSGVSTISLGLSSTISTVSTVATGSSTWSMCSTSSMMATSSLLDAASDTTAVASTD